MEKNIGRPHKIKEKEKLNKSSSYNDCGSKQDEFEYYKSTEVQSKSKVNKTTYNIVKNNVCVSSLIIFIILCLVEYFFSSFTKLQPNNEMKNFILSCLDKTLVLLITQKPKIPPPM